jgi:molybdate transport repressor ModE-like protein
MSDKQGSGRKIQIQPAWQFVDESGQVLDPKLFVLLSGVHTGGKLTKAAELAGISYRHAWNLLNKWAAFFSCPLVSLQKGRGASLTPLGEKLLWAHQRVGARFEPQLEGLTSELNLAIQDAMSDVRPRLRLHAAHGYAVALLPGFANNFQLDLQYCSGEQALAALARGSCDVAGFHVPQSDISEDLIERYSKLLKPRAYKLIRFISRQQGLIVTKDKVLEVQSLKDVASGRLRFINRQQGTDTRALLDELLRKAGVEGSEIQGYDNEEFTHSAVAAYVASGAADVGFGVEHAAAQFGLEFVPLATESYLMVCHQKSLTNSACERFIALLSSPEYREAVKGLAGYSAEGCGELTVIEEGLNWYRS